MDMPSPETNQIASEKGKSHRSRGDHRGQRRQGKPPRPHLEKLKTRRRTAESPVRPRHCAPSPLLNALLRSNTCSRVARRSYAYVRTSPPRRSQASVAPPLLAAPRRPSAHAHACDPDCPPPVLHSSSDSFVLLLNSCSSSSETPPRVPQKPVLRRCTRNCSPSSAIVRAPVRPPTLLHTLLRNPCSCTSETQCSSAARDPPLLMHALLNALLRSCTPSSAPA